MEGFIVYFLQGACNCASLDAKDFQESEVHDFDNNSLIDSVAIHNQFYRKEPSSMGYPLTPTRKGSSFLASPPKVNRLGSQANSIFRDVPASKIKLVDYDDIFPPSHSLDDDTDATVSTADCSSIDSHSSLLNKGNTYWLDSRDSVMSLEETLSMPWELESRLIADDQHDKSISMKPHLRRVQSDNTCQR